MAGRTSADTRKGRPEPLLDLQGYISAEDFAEATEKTKGCILERIDRRKTIIDTAFSSGDVAIAVQFFKRDVADSTGRTFVDEGKVGIANRTELRHVGFDMNERDAVERLVRRRSRRANAVQQQAPKLRKMPSASCGVRSCLWKRKARCCGAAVD